MPYGSKSVVSDTNGSVVGDLWDVPGVGPVPSAPLQTPAMAQDLAAWAAVPGQVMQPQQPQVPGQWSDVDEAIRQSNLAAQYQWGPQTGLVMTGAGGAPADASLAMGRPSIEYLNARRAAKPVSGGTKQATEVKYAPESALTPEEITAQKIESQWSDQRIAQEVMWDKLFERFGLTRGYSLDETFGSGSRKFAVPLAFKGSLNNAEKIFDQDGATIHKIQKPGRWPTYVATSPIEGEAYQFGDLEQAKQWVAPPKIMRPDAATPGELPPWESSILAAAMFPKLGYGDEPPKQTGPREPVLPILPDEPMPKPRKPTGEGIHSDIPSMKIAMAKKPVEKPKPPLSPTMQKMMEAIKAGKFSEGLKRTPYESSGEDQQ